MFRFDYDQYGKVYVAEYFMKGSRGQYGGEGYITAALALLTSAAFLAMIKADKLVQGDLRRRILIGVCILITFVGVQMYVYCYKLKTPWYHN